VYKIVLLIFLFVSLVFGQNIIIDNSDVKLTDFKMSYYDDATAKMDYLEVRSKKFVNSTNKISLGTKNGVIWSQIVITNISDKTRKLYIHHPHAYHYQALNFYEEHNNQLIKKIDIDFDSEVSEKYVYGGIAIYEFSLAPNQTKTIYMQSKFFSHQWFTVMIYDKQNSRKSLVNSTTDIALLVGILLALAIYNLLIFISSSRRENLYYSLYLIFASIWISLSYGLLANLFNLYGSLVFKINYSLMLMPIFLILFIMTIFNTKKKYKKEHLFLQSVIFFISVNIVYGFFDFISALKIASLAAAYTIVITLFTTISFYKKRNPLAKYFIIGHAFFIVFNVLAVLFYKGFVEYNYVTSHGVGIGIATEAIMLAFIIAYRIKLLEEKDREFQRTLEDKVKDRTKELELEKYKAQEATKSKSNFLATMSHEIRTPMNGIVGMTHLALQTELTPKQKHYIQNIKSSSSSLLNIINDILDFSKIEAGKLQIYRVDFNFYKLLDAIKNSLELQMKGKGLLFEITYDSNVPEYLHGDSLRITQIITNIISNALKFTNSGYVKLDVKNRDGVYVFSVKDSGIGITPEHQVQLFKSYSQADESISKKYGGTGLGLSISKQLVELMGGKIYFSSEVGVGSTFVFELTIADADENFIDEDFKLENLSDKLHRNGSNILLVEDDLINQEIFVGLLENSLINIDLANNGLEAVNMVKKNQNKYELIFMDVNMPTMGGYEATKLIREIDTEVSIVALTANAMNQDVQDAKKSGMNEHLSKPIIVEKLYEILLKYISKKSDYADIEIENNHQDEVIIPKFVNIDTEIGLKLLDLNKKLYLGILNKFYGRYKDFKLAILNDKDFAIQVHTLKGLSKNIGACSLHKYMVELEETQNMDLLSSIDNELQKVLSELENIDSVVEVSKNKIVVSKVKIDEMFLELKNAIISARPQKCEIVIDELNGYILDEEHSKLLDAVKGFVSEYNFKKALETLETKSLLF